MSFLGFCSLRGAGFQLVLCAQKSMINDSFVTLGEKTSSLVVGEVAATHMLTFWSLNLIQSTVKDFSIFYVILHTFFMFSIFVSFSLL